MRADRLLSILLLLQTHERMTARDLAAQLEVSERTIYRDFEALGMAGIPIYTERGPNGGCSLLDGYQTTLTGLTDVEVRALFLFSMASPLADLGLGKALNDALLKLSAALPAAARASTEQVRQRFHLDSTWWYHENDAAACLQTIQEAIWQDRKLCLVYSEDDGTCREQLVEPYGLVAKAGVWYLVARTGCAMDVLRVSRIHMVEQRAEQFQRITSFDLAAYWTEYCAELEAQHPQFSASLRIAPDELQTLPQRLSEAGYMLVESAELDDSPVLSAAPVHYVQRFQRRRQPKKEKKHIIATHVRVSGNQRKKTPSRSSSSKKSVMASQKKAIMASGTRKKSVLSIKKKKLFYYFHLSCWYDFVHEVA